jgi:hypothetical protein
MDSGGKRKGFLRDPRSRKTPDSSLRIVSSGGLVRKELTHRRRPSGARFLFPCARSHGLTPVATSVPSPAGIEQGAGTIRHWRVPTAFRRIPVRFRSLQTGDSSRCARGLFVSSGQHSAEKNPQTGRGEKGGEKKRPRCSVQEQRGKIQTMPENDTGSFETIWCRSTR